MELKEKLVLGSLLGLFILSVLIGVSSKPRLSDAYGSSGTSRGKSPAVAVIPLYGVIESRSSDFLPTGIDSVMQLLEAIEKDDSVKAVVIRVNSPGGQVGSSQELYHEIKGFRERSGKPVVISVVDVGASGAYWVALAGDYIFANPGSLVGSMGVITQSLDLSRVPDKYGVGIRTYKAGNMKDILNPWRAETPEEKRVLNNMLKNIHAQFVNTLIKQRKLSRKQAMRLADGRIFTGEQALRSGLIDGLGGQQAAILYAAKLAGLTEKPRVIHKTRTGLKQFMSILKNSMPNLSSADILGVSQSYYVY